MEDIKTEEDTVIKNTENHQESLKSEENTKTEEVDSNSSETVNVINNEDKNKILADEYLNSLKRLQAEFDNFRKREEKQRNALKDYVIENLAKDLLPVIDNFERGINSLNNENTSFESFVEGIKLVLQQFESFLTKYNIKKMETDGKPFNPELHDAISKVMSDKHEENVIINVVQNGWFLNDKIIRHAQVVVSGGKP